MATITPFIRNPDNIAVGLNVAYTVPAGYVARLSVALSTDAAANASAGGSTSTTGAGTGGNNSVVSVIVIPAGTVISSSRTAASAANSTSTITATSTVTMTVNGSNSFSCTSRASIGANPGQTSNAISGAANFGFLAEEYAI